MRINPFVYGVLVLALFLGTVGIFQAAGIWSTSGKVTEDGTAVQPSAADVDTIKGWMTLEQISSTYQVPLDELLTQFELPAETPATTAIKDLENDLFSVTNLRDWLLSRMTPASTPEADISVNPTAQPAAAEITVVPTSAQDTAVTPTVHTAPDATITGKTTFQNLLDWGVTREDIEVVIGGELPASSTTIIKDYVTGKSLDFATIKAALQAEVEKAK